MQAIKSLSEANDLAAKAAKSVDELPRKKQETEAAILALENRISKVGATVQYTEPNISNLASD